MLVIYDIWKHTAGSSRSTAPPQCAHLKVIPRQIMPIYCYQHDVRVKVDPLLSIAITIGLVLALLRGTSPRTIHNDNKIVGNNNNAYQRGRTSMLSFSRFRRWTWSFHRVQQPPLPTSTANNRWDRDHWAVTRQDTTLVSMQVSGSLHAPTATPEADRAYSIIRRSKTEGTRRPWR